MENEQESDFVTIRESNSAAELIERSREKLAFTLWLCFLLGVLAFISLCGFIQQVHPTFLDTIRRHRLINELWFEMHWSVWATLLIIFILVFLTVKNLVISKVRTK